MRGKVVDADDGLPMSDADRAGPAVSTQRWRRMQLLEFVAMVLEPDLNLQLAKPQRTCNQPVPTLMSISVRQFLQVKLRRTQLVL